MTSVFESDEILAYLLRGVGWGCWPKESSPGIAALHRRNGSSSAVGCRKLVLSNGFALYIVGSRSCRKTLHLATTRRCFCRQKTSREFGLVVSALKHTRHHYPRSLYLADFGSFAGCCADFRVALISSTDRGFEVPCFKTLEISKFSYYLLRCQRY
ncbi:unnamed protein product [Soboliphyme baturini]|uniref:GST N-terminal domain-containing protein n=1 Tax=Soboliphyme baturini TaxID=241478 RepID=A0A183I997_9BILA|nr:unnamed protein product [Soboliphyme baturini]